MNWIEQKRRITNIIFNIARSKECEFARYSKDAQERANEAEGAMQSRYDTFKEEGQYLAGGLKQRHEELKSAVATIKNIQDNEKFGGNGFVQLYSVILVDFEDDEGKTFFLFPVMGGEKIEEDITVITPSSPLSRALIGKEEGDDFHFTVNGKTKTGEIISVK